MCHHCGAETKNTEDNNRENGDFSRVSSGGPIWLCKFCGEKQDMEPMKPDGWSSYTSSVISPTNSLSSSNSNVSTCSESSVDSTSSGRVNQHKCDVEGDQGCVDQRLKNLSQSSGFKTVLEGVHSLNGVEQPLENLNSSNSVNTVQNAEVITSGSGQEEPRDNSIGISNGSLDEEIETPYCFDDYIWEPPEAEDPVDDTEGSVANNDDDDECGDGTEWGKPSSLTDFRNEGSGSYKYKEEKQRVIKELANGKFKALVSQLLKSIGIASHEEDVESWVDIVSSISWEAASYVKPGSIDGKAMGLDGYVKVKCVATGSRNQSELVKGLVFKKHAAHKRMPTSYKNPKLLLIQGMLGQSSSVLSSFRSMEEEKDYLKSFSEMIEMCHPNVILVEKTVTRDVQEYILEKGVTLVLDMKLHRLERIARYTGSPILSSNALMVQKLKKCESFHFKKFLEEHAGLGEEGKKPSKTLMFIEGCPTRLGCTILLKGSHSDDLKKIKCVVRCAVAMAYHLILETSFLLDQKAMFSTIVSGEELNILSSDLLQLNVQSNRTTMSGLGDFSPRKTQAVDIPFSNGFHGQQSSDISSERDALCAENFTPKTCIFDIPISNGFDEDGHFSSNSGSEGNSPTYQLYEPDFSSISGSLNKVAKESIPRVSSSHKELSSCFDSNGQISKPVILPEALEANGPCDVAIMGKSNAKSHDSVQSSSLSVCREEIHNEQPSSLPACREDLHNVEDNFKNDGQTQSKDGINSVLDSQSILVLMSSRNAIRGTICQQNHFSHIMFYRNFDVPLGKFLHDNILNQRSQCDTCGELPESHIYYYAHHNRQLTIQIKRLPSEKRLPGETEGKLWMWSSCSKCKPDDGSSRSTKRVLISSASRSLSLGKFLELSFSRHYYPSKLSSCGHSLQKDFIYLFGLGPMVAMFRYSSVATYMVSIPPEKLEFSHSIKQECLRRETENLYTKGISLFMDIENSLEKIGSQFSGLTMNLGGSLKKISDIKEMLEQERCEFETNVQNAIGKNGKTIQPVYKLLNLNKIRWELLIESCVWERRLHSLFSRDHLVRNDEATVKAVQDQNDSKMDGTAGKVEQTHSFLEIGDKDFSDSPSSKWEMNMPLETNEAVIKEIPVESAQESNSADDLLSSARVTEEPGIAESDHAGGRNCQVENSSQTDHLPDRTIEISSDQADSDGSSDENSLKASASPHSLSSSLETLSGWCWMPFSEIRQLDMKDLHRVYLPKFESVSVYTPEHLPKLCQMITEEGSRLHIPVGTGNYVVSDYEGELSSIIACAVAFLKDIPLTTEAVDEDGRKVSGITNKSTESLQNLSRIPTIMLSHWSMSSSDLDAAHSSSEEIRFSSFDGLSLLDSLDHSILHPEVSMGFVKSLGKTRKYSVICLYAKQFCDLRNRCCPSELDYIASLSRCMNWDAKGGKSKSVFAKTLDDRFIIKEIKKTEFESFMKFAPAYFKYMKQSYESGNQTCLAKVLGIYQVVIRQTKSGKEMRHDLMVMENLSFGRSISRQYDLKGALHARFNTAADGSGEVLLDQNFVNDMNSSPLYISQKAKRVLERAVWNDTTFLNSINVMDYSLLVGVDTPRRELVCGIIDYLRQYTWDKQLETWVKSSFSVPRNVLPTIISPKEYKKRFRKFMTTYFLSVPDHWCSQRPSDPCELCGVKDKASQSKVHKRGELNANAV